MQATFPFIALETTLPCENLRSLLQERLSQGSLNEAYLREALLFLHVKFQQMLPTKSEATLSALIVTPDLIAGAGDFTVHTLDGELLFSDPLKIKLGTLEKPLIHIRHILRHDLDGFNIQGLRESMTLDLALPINSSRKKNTLFVGATTVVLLFSVIAPLFVMQDISLPAEVPPTLIRVDEVKPLRTHSISQGDTLSTISQKYYGTSKRWQDIYDMNKEKIPSQNQLKAGVLLALPD